MKFDFLPEILITNTFGGAPIGHWLIVIALAFIAYYASLIVTKIVVNLVSYIFHKIGRENSSKVTKTFDLPLRLYAGVWVLIEAADFFTISEVLTNHLNVLASVVGAISVLILLWKLVNVVVEIFEEKMTEQGNKSALSIGIFLDRIVKFILISIALVSILGSFGVDITTAVAALGVGGIALALGAQKAVENFVGSITVIFDQPLRVGDFCKAAGVLGTVEEIGVRSTRIRTLDRSLVTIPNGSLSSSQIENYSHRDKIKFQSTIGLTYDTNSEQLQKVLDGFKKMLAKYKYVDKDPRVRFVSYGDFSLNVEIFAYIKTIDYADYLEKIEELNFEIMKVVEGSGSDFAFPSQTIYKVDVEK